MQCYTIRGIHRICIVVTNQLTISYGNRIVVTPTLQCNSPFQCTLINYQIQIFDTCRHINCISPICVMHLNYAVFQFNCLTRVVSIFYFKTCCISHIVTIFSNSYCCILNCDILARIYLNTIITTCCNSVTICINYNIRCSAC